MAVVLPFVATFADKGTKQAIASIKKVESQWGGFGNSLKKAAAPAAAVGAAIALTVTDEFIDGHAVALSVTDTV